MFDPTKPVQTRDGRKARIVATDLDNGQYSICAITTGKDGGEYPDTFTDEGIYYTDDLSERHNDLINIPVKHVRYININKIGNVHSMHNYETKEHAENNCSDNRLACIRIEYEEGQFDE